MGIWLPLAFLGVIGLCIWVFRGERKQAMPEPHDASHVSDTGALLRLRMYPGRAECEAETIIKQGFAPVGEPDPQSEKGD